MAAAWRRVPSIYDALQSEFDAEAINLSKAKEASPALSSEALTVGHSVTAAGITSRPAVSDPVTSVLTIDAVCQLYRNRILQGELRICLRQPGMRKEFGEIFDPVTVAKTFRARLEHSLTLAKSELMLFDYGNANAFLDHLASEGIGRVQDRERAGRELTRTHVQVLGEIITDDEALLPAKDRKAKAAPAPESAAPKLSDYVDRYLNRRGDGVSGERADTIKATVRDLITIVGDKPVDTYSHKDAETYEGIMLSLPANWDKKRELRDLSIQAAAAKAMGLGLPRQAARTIRKKWSILHGVFKQASIRYPLLNPFIAGALAVNDGVAANSDWDPFTRDELAALLASSRPGHLHWLTLLALWTGARLGELCQLKKDHVREHNGLHYVYFSPELRLKTGEKESCIRSVPLHAELIEVGVLDYVASRDSLLFPGIPQHKSGRYSDAPSKHFSRHLQRIGIKRPKLSFHSLRHTFVAAFGRCAPRDAETRERLVGHTVPGVTGRYGNSHINEAHDMVLLAERAKALALVRF